MSDSRDVPLASGADDGREDAPKTVPSEVVSSPEVVLVPRRRKPLRRAWTFVRETVIVLVTAMVLSLLIKTFLAQAFYIPSESMEDTLMINDRVLVSLLEPGPLPLERGDIVVFRDPGGWLGPVQQPVRSAFGQTAVDVLTFVGILPQDSGEHLIKRVIGLPGDHVTCAGGEAPIVVNGTELRENYLAPGASPCGSVPFDVVVPKDSVWVMGDNRDSSLDSRYHQTMNHGALKENYIVGRAVVLFWPFDRITTLSNHPEVFDRVSSP